jgi:hypothetical protein
MPIKKNIKISWLLSLLFVLTVWSPASLQTDIQDKPGVQKMSQDDQSRKLLDYIKVLTSESYGGRITGTPEYQACADWVSSPASGHPNGPLGSDFVNVCSTDA